jgi:protein TonB
MSCNDVASILVSHRASRLAPAERAQVEEHLLGCADCSAAWHAESELTALHVPPVPATLLERALLASRLPQSAPARRARMSVVVGSVMLAGIAAAAITIGSLTTSSPSAPGAMPETTRPPAAEAAESDEPLERSETPAAAEEDEHPISVELVELALGVQPVVRLSPDYPPDALKAGIEGHVQLKFDVTASGIVENVSVVESSDAQFEPPAVLALSGWRYLPRIEAGKRVGSKDVRTIIRFALNRDPAAVALRTLPPPDMNYAAFNDALAIAMDRLAADDLRGVELQLDEMQALYGAERANLWNFYGYLYTIQGNYGRAIDAYERSVTLALQSTTPASGSGPYVALANLYFARHQYDMALKTLLRPRQATNGTLPPGGSRLVSAEATALIEQLRALGVTEETL